MSREVLIGTYNMSFASDQGLDPRREDVYESEAAFLLSAPAPRAFFQNALSRLTRFFAENPTAAAVGLQEINKTAPGSGTGSDAISAACKAVRPTLEVETQTVPGFGGALVGISMVWDTAIFGIKNDAKVVDLNDTPTEIPALRGQSGRPMLMVLTASGNLLVSLHAPNQVALAELTQRDLYTNISRIIFDSFPTVPTDNMFITGDFNDRYDALAGFLPLPYLGRMLSYKGRAPLSCCHNWDSSCTESRYIPKPDFVNQFSTTKDKRVNVGTCDPQGRKLAGPGAREPMGVEGNIENYRYYGDKVFGARPITEIQIYNPNGKTGPSTESDHEMVFAGFEFAPSNSSSSAASSAAAMKTNERRRRTRRRSQRRRSHRRSRRN